MKKFRAAPFKFQPFSRKQLKVLTWWMDESPVRDKDVIIADGAVRAGKTLPMSLSYIFWAMATFNGQKFGMAGKTIGALRRNVIILLKLMLKARGYRVTDHRADNLLIVSRQGVTNYFYLFGGKDERSQDLIQGITLAGMYFDEVALMPQSFVNQATARCSVDGSKIWFNCNPQGPFHWFKLEWIDKLDEKNAVHLHFTMDDNLSLSERIKERYRRMYTGVFFKRYILGLWVMAEGIIFDMWDDKTHVIECPAHGLVEYGVALDYATATVMTFGLYGIVGNKVYLIKEYYWDAKKRDRQKTDSEFAEDFKSFLGDITPKHIYLDPSAASFKVELRKRGYNQVRDADNDVINGIRLVANFLSTGRFFVDRSCKDTIQEFSTYTWDPKAQARGEDKPVKENDHAMDRNRYYIYSRFGKVQPKAIKAKPKGW